MDDYECRLGLALSPAFRRQCVLDFVHLGDLADG